jgi:hypothetical protein
MVRHDHVEFKTRGDGDLVDLSPAVSRALFGQRQQPVLVECDNRPRTRTVTITVIGE